MPCAGRREPVRREEESGVSKKIDEVCAKALGWTDIRYMPEKRAPYRWRGFNPKGVRQGLPTYSSDPAAVHLLEDEIERRGLQERYIYELERIIASRDHWEYIRATPEQRARAFLATIGEQAT